MHRSEKQLTNNPHTLTTKDFLLTPKSQTVYPIRESELDRVERLIASIPQRANWYERLANVCIGIFAAASVYLIGLTTLPSVPNWMWIVSWIVTLVPFVVCVLAFILDDQDRRGMGASVQAVLKEIEQLKETYAPAHQHSEPVDQEDRDHKTKQSAFPLDYSI